MAAKAWSSQQKAVDEVFFQNDAVSLCLLMNRRAKTMRVVDFRRRGRNAVSLVEIERLGHAWSGGASGQPFSDPGGPDASRLAWAFVAKCFREADAAKS